MIVTKPTQEKTMKTVYCLYRVSTKGQVDKNDIPMQKQSCREFAEHQPTCINALIKSKLRQRMPPLRKSTEHKYRKSSLKSKG